MEAQAVGAKREALYCLSLLIGIDGEVVGCNGDGGRPQNDVEWRQGGSDAVQRHITHPAQSRYIAAGDIAGWWGLSCLHPGKQKAHLCPCCSATYT